MYSYEFVTEKGNNICLPNYTVNIAEQMEKAHMANTNGGLNFRQKINRLYEFCTSVVGKENMEKEVGKLDNADPNEINILYLAILDCYNKPLEDYEQRKLDAKMDSAHIDKLSNILDKADKAGALSDA